MKRTISILLAVALCLACVVSLSGCGSTSDTYKIRISCDTVDTSVLTKSLRAFAEKIQELSNGKVTAEVYSNGSLYKGVAGLEATQAGNLEMCMCSLSNYGEFSPKVFVLSLPFVLPTNQAVFDAYSGELGQLAVEDINKYNLEFLSYFVYGGTDISSNKPIHVPSDIKGMTTRVFGLANSSFIEHCGGAPTFMSGGEVTQALSTKMIDGALTSAESMVERKYYEFQSHFCAVGFERADQMVAMNLEWWNKLPEEIKGYVKAAMDAITMDEWTAATSNEELARKALTEKGATVYYPTEAELTEWYAVADKVYEEFRETLGDELVDKALEFRNQYE